MIFDAHTHLFSRQFYGMLWKQKTRTDATEAQLRDMLAPLNLELPPADPAEHAARLVKELDAHKIDRAILFTSLPGEQTSVAAAVRAQPKRLTGYTMVNPLAPNALATAQRDLTELGLRGIELFPAMHRFDPSDEKVVYPFYELAAKFNAPVFCHVGILRVKLREKLGLPSPFDARFSNPVLLHRAATDHPKVKFIVPHFGCGYLREAAFLGLQCPNVFIDTSSSNEWLSLLEQPLTLARALKVCLDSFGPARILFGTDSSVLPRGYRADILAALRAAFDELQLDTDTRRKILGMNLAVLLRMAPHDFASNYESGDMPWNSRLPTPDLVRTLDSGQLPGKTVLEIGCGTGSDAIEMARRGYKVTAIDIVEKAAAMARERAAQAGVSIDFRVGDVLKADLGGSYDIIYDRGVYHYLRRIDLPAFQAVLKRVTHPGSMYLSLAGNAKEQAEYGPPRVFEHEIRADLEPLFDIVDLRETHFVTDNDAFKPLAWSILMRRK